MKIDHIAVWSKDIEKLKIFYTKYFNAKCSNKYVNEKKEFQSYFLSFNDGARLEIMQVPNLNSIKKDEFDFIGLAHFAISAGSRETVDSLTSRLNEDGYKVLSEPRITGDGYYESIVLDPDGNKIEITI